MDENPTPPPARSNSFLAALKQHPLYGVGLGYLLGAWAVLQVAAVVLPAFGAPLWVLRGLMILLALGLGATLLTTWSRERRRAGLPQLPRASRGRVGWVLTALLPAAAVTTFFLLRPLSRPSPASALLPVSTAPEKSVAVLPFDNLSDDKSNGYFAEGIQDEILTDLAKVADLKVISRTSVQVFAPGTARNVREIGRVLGVAYVLEGSVQRAPGRVRVTAQLIDARTDTHLWADRYDRDLADIFAIQSEMAESIAASLRARLSPNEKNAINTRPTANLAAYDLYLQAKDLVERFQETADWRDTLGRAVRLLDEAIGRDQKFALAYCLAAKAHDFIYANRLDHTLVRVALEENAVAEALRLQPDLGEAHLARALLLFHARLDYTEARRELAVARAALPNSAEVYSLTSYLDRRQGRWPDALPSQERAVSLDPRNPMVLNDQGVLYDMLRLYRDEIRVSDKAIAVAPASADYFRVIKGAALLAAGQIAAARGELARLPADYDPNGSTTFVRVYTAFYDGHPDEAARVVAAFKGSDYSGINGLMTPRGWLEALAARAAGDAEGTRAALTRAREGIAAAVLQRPDDPDELAQLGLIDAGLGRKEDALREGRRAVELRPVALDAMEGPGVLAALAMICAWTDEPDEAMKHLAVLAKTPGGPDYGQLRFDPAWGSLRGRPDYQTMLAQLDPHLGP